MSDEREQAISTIVELNRLKVCKPNEQLTHELNRLQRKLEDRYDTRAVEHDPRYNE